MGKLWCDFASFVYLRHDSDSQTVDVCRVQHEYKGFLLKCVAQTKLNFILIININTEHNAWQLYLGLNQIVNVILPPGETIKCHTATSQNLMQPQVFWTDAPHVWHYLSRNWYGTFCRE